jgi:hypothetical protein
MTTTLTLAALLLAAEPAADVGAQQDKSRQEAVAVLAPAKAKLLALRVGESEPVNAKLHAEPLLRWSNPTAGSVHGEVFLWTADGRPAAVASIYRWYHPFKDSTVEIVSLSTETIVAKDADTDWQCPEGGIRWQSLADGPRAAASRNARLGQFRSLARRFAAELADRRGGDEVARKLRLLAQPVFRYETDSAEGALFAFVENTDPEAWLLLESDLANADLPWRFALARMNSDALRIKLDERQVADCPKISQPWKSRTDHYGTFGFDPASLPGTAP